MGTKYLLKHMKFQQPCNLMKALIQEVCEHLLKRQEIDGPEEAFHFKLVKISNVIVPACYPNGVSWGVDCANATHNAQKMQNTRKVSASAHSWEPNLTSLTLPGGNTMHNANFKHDC